MSTNPNLAEDANQIRDDPWSLPWSAGPKTATRRHGTRSWSGKPR